MNNVWKLTSAGFLIAATLLFKLWFSFLLIVALLLVTGLIKPKKAGVQ